MWWSSSNLSSKPKLLSFVLCDNNFDIDTLYHACGSSADGQDDDVRDMRE